ncbi:MAG: HAD family hydrolase [Anaerolineales bacterium]|nr:HAD family hydrolase [Anaerolineales bacterium]
MPLELDRIKALCFDVDGTLRDTDDQYQDKLVRLFTPAFRLAPNQDVHKAARRVVMFLDTPINAVYTLLDRLHLDASVISLLEKLNDLKLRPSREDLPLIPGTKESLDLLAARYPMAVVSARGKAGTEEFITHQRLNRHFICIASGQTTAHTKPWPDPVLWAAGEMKVAPENCLMIGDTTVDIRSGKAAGAQTVGVLSGFGDQKELLRAGADLVVEDVATLTQIILNG